MKKVLLSLVLVSLFVQCSTKEENPFLISKGKIGKLTKETTVAQLDSIFVNDSLVKRIGEGDYVQAGSDNYLVYSKEGEKLLSLTPKQQHDPAETIETVQIYDPRFVTDKGVSLSSTFKELREQYTINSIQNTLRNIVIFVNEIDAYFTIDKAELPADLRYDTSLNIDAVQIPDEAKIKFMMLGWE